MHFKHKSQHYQNLYGGIAAGCLSVWLISYLVELLLFVNFSVSLLLAAVLIPIAIVCCFQAQVLQSEAEQLTALGFRYLRLLNGLTLVIWLAWLGLSLTPEIRQLGLALDLWLGTERYLERETLKMALLVMPPMGVILSCYRLSYPLFVRLSGDLAADWMQQVMRGQLWGFLPLGLFFWGCRLFLGHQLSPAIGLFAAACLSQALLNQWAAQKFTTQALTFGEFRDRVFKLAEQAGVSLQQIYLISAVISTNQQGVNAFAAANHRLILTDTLLCHLSKREVEAVIAHELIHLKRHHAQILQTLLILAMVLPVCSYGVLAPRPMAVGMSLTSGIGMVMTYYYCARCFEYAADREAIQLTGDPLALIQSLVKLAQLNSTPLDWGKRTGLLLSHPSMRQRLEVIKRQWSDKLEQEGSLTFSDLSAGCKSAFSRECYTLPQSLALPLVFSTKFKQTLSRCQTAGRILVMTLPAVGASLLTAGADWTIGAWLWHSVGLAVTLVLLWLLLNIAPLWGNQHLRQRLYRKLQSPVFDSPFDWTEATFVGLAPDAMPRCYEGLPHWDVGFLFWQANRLCYRGEQAHLDLTAEQIQRISLSRASSRASWWQPPFVCLSWQTATSSGVLRLQPRDVGSLRAMRTRVYQFKRQLQRQLQCQLEHKLKQAVAAKPSQSVSLRQAVSDANPDSPMTMLPMTISLTAEPISVTGQSLKQMLVTQLRSDLLLIPLSLGVSILLNLPLAWQPGSWFCVLLTAAVGMIVQFLLLILSNAGSEKKV